MLTSLACVAQSEDVSVPPIRFLTQEAGYIEAWASFSPDGQRVLFSRTTDPTDPQKPWDLHVVSIVDKRVERFLKDPSPVSATRAKWSKQNVVAFAGMRGNDAASIWLVNGDGTQARELSITGVSKAVFYPSWYPDGRSIAVVDVLELTTKRIELDRLVAVAMTSRERVLTGMPSVSPDGRTIAFAGQANEGQRYDQTKNVIWLVDDRGTLQTAERPAQQGRTPSWSPDGRWIAFESNRGDPSQLYAIFIMKRDGTAVRRMTSYSINANHPMWSPDGKQLVFSARHTAGEQATGIAILDVGKLE
jgi:Tol biopolymer transport system component